MAQCINEQIGTIPAIEAKFHLFKIRSEMLGTQTVPCSHDAALEQRERGFDGVRVNIAHDIDAGTVVNFLVVCPLGLPHGGIVRGCVIGEDYFHVLGDIFADVLCESSALCIVGVEEAEIAIALADADNHFLVVVLCDVTLAAHHAADVGNVHFDFAIEHRLVRLRHRVPDAMAEIPCCLVTSDSKGALNLAGRNSFLRLAEKESRHEPTHKRQMRIVEDSASGHAKLVLTVFAVEEMLFGFEQRDWPLTTQATWPFREAQPGEQFAALGIRREHRVNVN